MECCSVSRNIPSSSRTFADWEDCLSYPGSWPFHLQFVYGLGLSLLAFSRRVVTTFCISIMIRPQMINYKENFIIYLTTMSYLSSHISIKDICNSKTLGVSYQVPFTCPAILHLPGCEACHQKHPWSCQQFLCSVP